MPVAAAAAESDSPETHSNSAGCLFREQRAVERRECSRIPDLWAAATSAAPNSTGKSLIPRDSRPRISDRSYLFSSFDLPDSRVWQTNSLTGACQRKVQGSGFKVQGFRSKVSAL